MQFTYEFNIKMDRIKPIIHCILIVLFLCWEGCHSDPPIEEDVPPTIEVLGQNPLKLVIYNTFVDDVVRIEALNGLDSVWIQHNIDTAQLGFYQIKYFAKAKNGLEAEAKRDVWVIVMPSTMKGTWNVVLQKLPDAEPVFAQDSLTVEQDTLIINNFNNIEQAKIKLYLTSDLQDSVIIAKQYVADSTYEVFGRGKIDPHAQNINLYYTVMSNNDTVMYNAVYTINTVADVKLKH
jgi:hypothetical protein